MNYHHLLLLNVTKLFSIYEISEIEIETKEENEAALPLSYDLVLKNNIQKEVYQLAFDNTLINTSGHHQESYFWSTFKKKNII